jgi:hypothetical protein
LIMSYLGDSDDIRPSESASQIHSRFDDDDDDDDNNDDDNDNDDDEDSDGFDGSENEDVSDNEELWDNDSHTGKEAKESLATNLHSLIERSRARMKRVITKYERLGRELNEEGPVEVEEEDPMPTNINESD